MGLPGKRRTASSGRRRAAHFALAKPSIMSCQQCGKVKRPHYACRHCGYYRGTEVVNTLHRATKRTTRNAKRSTKTTNATK